MTSLTVIEAVDVVSEIVGCFSSAPVSPAVNPFPLGAAEEGLHRRGRLPRSDARSPLGPFGQAWTSFYNLPRGLQDLDGHGLLANLSLQLPNLFLELTHTAQRHNRLASFDRGRTAALGELAPATDH